MQHAAIRPQLRVSQFPLTGQQRCSGCISSSEFQDRGPSEVAEKFFSSSINGESKGRQFCKNAQSYFSLRRINANEDAPHNPSIQNGPQDQGSDVSSASQRKTLFCNLFASVDSDSLTYKLNNEARIGILCQQGELGRALDVLSQVNTSLSTNSYLSLLKACQKNKASNEAKRVYEHISRHNHQTPDSLGDYLVLTLAKCGALEDAHSILLDLPSRSVVSWTAIISAYAYNGDANEAIRLHKCMLEDGVEPNNYTFVSLLKACRILQDLERGKELHAEARRRGFTSNIFVCGTLVDMYGKCGAVTEAELVFMASSQHNIATWNAMLMTYLDQGEAEKGLKCYRQMQEEGICPNRHTLLLAVQICVLLVEEQKASSMERHPPNGMAFDLLQSLHSDARRRGFASDVFVGTTLVSSYGKCGAVREADYVFTEMADHNVVSWTAILSTKVDHDAGKMALLLYRQMHVEGVNPDKLASGTAIQACCSLVEGKELVVKGKSNKVVALEIGHAISTDPLTRGFITDVVFGTTLVTMYGKCGATTKAEHAFAAISQRNNLSWGAMLSMYLDQGQVEKTLLSYMQMQKEGVTPNQQMIVIALQSVCMLADGEEASVEEGQPAVKLTSFEIGLAIHADARRKGDMSDIFVSTILVSMYGKCGAVPEAEQVFVAMAYRNVVSWTAILSVYVEQGYGGKALQLYVQMMREGIPPDDLMSVIALQACAVLAENNTPKNNAPKAVAVEIGRALHHDVRRADIESDIFVRTALLNMYGKCGFLSEAEKVFKGFWQHDVVSWSAMLSAYVEQGHGEKALQLFRQMQQAGVYSDQLVSVIIIQACSILAEQENTRVVTGNSRKEASLGVGRALHADAHQKGFAYDLVIGNTIVTMYGKCGSVVEAEHVFGVVSPRNVVSWNAMISTYAEQGEGEKALFLYREMQSQCTTCDEVTLGSVLKACCMAGSLEICNHLLFDIVSAGYEALPSLAASVIHTFGSWASVRDAQTFFDKLSDPPLASWNACIAAHTGKGDSNKGLRMFDESKMAGMEPDGVTFTSAISACSHTGLVLEGLYYFCSMIEDFALGPEMKHYGSLLDLLARVGDFKRVMQTMATMPVQADEKVWLSLLGASRIHSNMELARHAFCEAINIQPKRAATYVAMSNMYADVGLDEPAGHEVEVWPELE